MFDNDSRLTDQKFKGLHLASENFIFVDFYHCTFRDCDFSNEFFSQCVLSECIFDNCNLSLVNHKKTRLRDVQFINSKLIGIDWTQAMSVSSLKYANCLLNEASFVGLDLPHLVLDECIAKNVYFQDCNLTKSVFKKNRFDGKPVCGQ